MSHILITGTSKGLGRSLADSYLLAGQHVIGCSRGPSAISHPNYQHFCLDFTDEQSISKMFAEMRETKLVPWLLINNAGVSQKSLFSFTTAQALREILGVNLFGTFLVCRETLKLMQRQRFGRVVNLCSINVPLASVGSSVYNATKAGLDVMGRTFANECKEYDITVNSIGLSLVANTGMTDSLAEAAIEAKQKYLVKPKLLEIDEILTAINFFASKEAKNITGQLLNFGGIR